MTAEKAFNKGSDRMKLLCPISGLRVYTQDNWQGKKLGTHFTANFSIVGRSVLYSRPSGTADLQSTRAVLRLSDEVARQLAGGTGRYVQIEDYAALDKATIEARKHFIDQMIARDRLLAVIFCNLSPMMQLFVKIGRRFNTTNKAVHVVRDYKEAIVTARRLCSEHLLADGPFVFGEPATYRDDSPTLIPVEVRSDRHWDVKTQTYTNRSLLLDRCILHSVSSGFFDEAHVPLIDAMRHRVRDRLSSNENLDYIVVDVSALKGGSRKGRKLYMQSLRDWYKQFPFSMYIIYGANAFMTAAVRLAKPFMPFRAIVAGDLDHAFELIRKDQNTQNKEEPTVKPGPVHEYVEELLAYIGGIDWGREESNDFETTVAREHPFYIVFQAIRLVKEELANLIRTHEQIQERLAQSEKKYRELFERGSDWLCFHALDGTLIHTNIAFKKGCGWNRELPANLNVRDLIPERHRPDFDDYLDRIKSQEHDEGTMIVTTAAGQEIVLEYKNVLIKDDRGEPIGVQGSARDITDRIQAERKSKILQEQLRQKHKMEAIGTMAGGVAHELNNILGIIIGNIELAAETIPKQNPASASLQEIQIASLRAKDVVHNILSVSSKMPATSRPIRVGALIEKALTLLRTTIPATIEIRSDIQCRSEMILADPTEITQVVMNLCVNSAYAMQDAPGVLEVKLETIHLDARACSGYDDISAGDFIKLTVKDTGKGIAPDIMDRIFDPYFTTKDIDEGLGMGLAVVYGIVKKHDGAIHVESSLGAGTTVEVLFRPIETQP